MVWAAGPPLQGHQVKLWPAYKFTPGWVKGARRGLHGAPVRAAGGALPAPGVAPATPGAAGPRHGDPALRPFPAQPVWRPPRPSVWAKLLRKVHSALFIF